MLVNLNLYRFCTYQPSRQTVSYIFSAVIRAMQRMAIYSMFAYNLLSQYPASRTPQRLPRVRPSASVAASESQI